MYRNMYGTVSLRCFSPFSNPNLLPDVKRSKQRMPCLAVTQGGPHELLQAAKMFEPSVYTTKSQWTDHSQWPSYDHWSHTPSLLSCCEPESAPLNVAVLLSGGVDSSLALYLLKAAGHRVTAFYLQIWFQEDFRNFWDACPWEEDLEYCQEVCKNVGVHLEVVPLTDAYWERVVAHCIAEIRAGRTPNPDILCNSRVKFGAFMEWLEASSPEKYDRIASGHYARVERFEMPRLAMTPDRVKDQTYFLAQLSQTQLSKVVFPLGAFQKCDVRSLAAAAALPNKSRADSQGICFLGKVKFEEFVDQHLGEWPGPIVEEESGNILGYHRGHWFHTPGQRKGLRLPGGPWYVTRKDALLNVVYASNKYHEDGGIAVARRNSFICGPIHFLSDLRIDPDKVVQCKVRHGPALHSCTVFKRKDGTYRVELETADQGLAAGQYAVFYQDAYCLGASIIRSEY